MKARILPTDEFAEYGKTRTVIVVASMNPTEAEIIYDYVAKENIWDNDEPKDEIPMAVRQFLKILEAVQAGSGTALIRQDDINTDGRRARRKSAPEEPNRPEGTARGIHNLPGLHG